MVSRYQKRISGPLLDRSAQPPCGIYIHVEVPRVDYEKLSSDPLGRNFAAGGAERGGAETRRGRPRATAPSF